MLSKYIAFECSLLSYGSRLVADHSPPSVAPDPHGDVSCLVDEGSPGVRPSCLPAPDNDGGVPVDADVVLVAVCLCPVAFTGPERSKYLLFAYRITSGVDLEIVRVHQTIESRDIELQVRKEPFAFRKEDLLGRIHFVVHALCPRLVLRFSRDPLGSFGLFVLFHLAKLSEDAARQQNVALALRVLGE
jgi:hypothetical protein